MEHTAKIAIIDDNADFVFTMETYLQRSGFETVAATSGEEGLKMVERHRPDIILLDVQMETFFSGFEVCKRLRSDPDLKHIPIIGVSAIGEGLRYFYDDKNRKHFCPDDFFDKPVDKRMLLSKIKELLHL